MDTKNFLKRLEFTEAFMLSQEAHVNSHEVLDALSVTSSLRNQRPNEHAPPVTEEMESHRFGWAQRHEDVDLSSSSKASGTEQIHASDDAIRSSWR